MIVALQFDEDFLPRKGNRYVCSLVGNHVAFRFNEHPKRTKPLSQHVYQYVPATLLGLWGVGTAKVILIPEPLVNVRVWRCNLLANIFQLIEKKRVQVSYVRRKILKERCNRLLPARLHVFCLSP